MTEYLISAFDGTTLEVFEDIERLRNGAGALVGDYLAEEARTLASDELLREDVVREGLQAAGGFQYFENLPELTRRRFGMQMRAAGAEVVRAARILEGWEPIDGAERITDAAARAGSLLVEQSAAISEAEIGVDRVQGMVLRFINTSETGTRIDITTLRNLLGGDLVANSHTARQALNALARGRGRTLEKNGDTYTILHTPGRPELVEVECDPVLSVNQTALALAVLNARANTLGIAPHHQTSFANALEATQGIQLAHGETLANAKADATRALTTLFQQPWRVARLLEVLPSRDPRRFLLANLLEQPFRDNALRTLAGYTPGLEAMVTRTTPGNAGDYTVTTLPVAEAPKPPRRRPRRPQQQAAAPQTPADEPKWR